MQQWIEANGRVPMWSDWEFAEDDHPCAKTIDRYWGWKAFRAAAVGVPARRLHKLTVRARPGFPGHGWTQSGLLRPLMEHYIRHGAWPVGKHWEAAAAEHPSRRTYVRHFGSWEQAVAAATRDLTRTAAAGRRQTDRRAVNSSLRRR